MKIKLFTKLFLSYLFLVMLCILTVVGFQLYFVQNYLLNSKEKELLTKANNYVSIIKPILTQEKNPREIVNSLNKIDKTIGTEIWVINNRGEIIAVSAYHLYCEGNRLEDADLQLLQAGKSSIKRGQSQYFKEAVIRVSAPIISKNRFLGAVILYSPVKGINDTFNTFENFFALAALIGFLFSGLIALLISRTISKPIKQITQYAHGIAEGELKQKVVVKSKDELADLAESFNYMSDKLAKYEIMRRDFVANVSHELRNPLTSIQGFISALDEGKYKNENEKAKYFSIVQQEVNRLSKLVNELLEISMFDAEAIKLNKENFEIKTVIRRAILSLKPELDNKNLVTKVITPDNIPMYFGDEDRIEQVIHNLLENAIRYSPLGACIVISAVFLNNEIAVEITDTGPGISKDEQEKIWERFYRVDKSRSRNDGGTGLGLAIVKEIVNKHKGTVRVESEVGKGTTFCFTLPV